MEATLLGVEVEGAGSITSAEGLATLGTQESLSHSGPELGRQEREAVARFGAGAREAVEGCEPARPVKGCEPGE